MGLVRSLFGEQTYEDGVTDGRKVGIIDTLDAIEGRHPDRKGRYAGPVPEELRAWCIATREIVDGPS